MYFCYRVKLATSETLQTNLATIDHLQKREQSKKQINRFWKGNIQQESKLQQNIKVEKLALGYFNFREW